MFVLWLSIYSDYKLVETFRSYRVRLCRYKTKLLIRIIDLARIAFALPAFLLDNCIRRLHILTRLFLSNLKTLFAEPYGDKFLLYVTRVTLDHMYIPSYHSWFYIYKCVYIYICVCVRMHTYIYKCSLVFVPYVYHYAWTFVTALLSQWYLSLWLIVSKTDVFTDNFQNRRERNNLFPERYRIYLARVLGTDATNALIINTIIIFIIIIIVQFDIYIIVRART